MKKQYKILLVYIMILVINKLTVLDTANINKGTIDRGTIRDLSSNNINAQQLNINKFSINNSGTLKYNNNQGIRMFWVSLLGSYSGSSNYYKIKDVCGNTYNSDEWVCY